MVLSWLVHLENLLIHLQEAAVFVELLPFNVEIYLGDLGGKGAVTYNLHSKRWLTKTLLPNS